MTTQITRDSGAVRAYEPRNDGGNGPAVWKCRGRVALSQRGYRGSTTRQCNTRLEEGQLFCGKCGGLIAWGGSVAYGGFLLKHLERLDLTPAG